MGCPSSEAIPYTVGGVSQVEANPHLHRFTIPISYIPSHGTVVLYHIGAVEKREYHFVLCAVQKQFPYSWTVLQSRI